MSRAYDVELLRPRSGPDNAPLPRPLSNAPLSGGKDSTVLAYVMKLLNERYGTTDHA